MRHTLVLYSIFVILSAVPSTKFLYWLTVYFDKFCLPQLYYYFKKYILLNQTFYCNSVYTNMVVIELKFDDY